ncbi:MAG: hypothetical protein M0Z30_18225 [Actinomycetota bacterium]|nr:hypothetical protein [Actinomycetota bacterium]
MSRASTASTMVSTGSNISSGIHPAARCAGVAMADCGDSTLTLIPWP